MGYQTMSRRAAAQKSLPYDAEIEYLESTGSQYINTGIIPSGDMEIGINFRYTETQSAILLGSRISNISRKFTIGSGESGTIIYVGFINPANNMIIPFDTNNHTIVFDVPRRKATADNNTVISLPNGIENYTLEMFLFACNQNNAVSYLAKAEIYNLWVKRNGIFVLDYKPVRVGQIGYMYDKISGQLFSNGGAGNFVLGPDK